MNLKNQKLPNKILTFTFLVSLVFSFSAFNLQSASAADDIGPFFSISLLGPATFHMGSYAAELEDQLALIGINVSYVDLTTWSGLFDRTYDYPGPYPVPTYSEGGFDILLSTMSSGGFEFRSEIYSSDAIIPVGYNVYQYNSTEYDSAATNLATSFLIEDRLTYIKEIQGIVHNDLPSIPIVHLMDNYVFDENLTNWNADLWNINYQLMENWTIPDQSEFRYAMHSEIGTFHPYQSYESYELQILRQIYPGLVEMHSDTKELLPYIAESYSTSDGITWNVQLRDDVKWADGESLNATDVKYSFELLYQGGLIYPNIPTWQDDPGATTVEIVSEFEVNIVFSEFTNYNQYRLTLSLLPKHIWNNTSPSVQADAAITWAETNPEKIIGAGPYQLKEYFPTNGTIKIERNDFYSSWSGITPYFDEICFDTYNNLDEAKLKFLDGDIDMIDEMFGLSVVEGQALLGAASEKVISQFTTELSINMENPYFGTGELCPISSEESAKHIRKAISYIIDRDYFSNIIHSELATPAATSISPVTHGFDDSIEADPYNLTLARLEMDAAGSKISSTPPDISGISLPIILGMIALLGSAQILLIKRKR